MAVTEETGAEIQTMGCYARVLRCRSHLTTVDGTYTHVRILSIVVCLPHKRLVCYPNGSFCFKQLNAILKTLNESALKLH